MASPAKKSLQVKHQSGRDQSPLEAIREAERNRLAEDARWRRKAEALEPYLIHHPRQVPKRRGNA